jgi:transposase-like protein
MKITMRQLKKIIKEEKARLDEGASTTSIDRLNDAMDDYVSSYLSRTPSAADYPNDALDSLREEVEGYIESRADLGEDSF